jgi:hypothetical protein
VQPDGKVVVVGYEARSSDGYGRIVGGENYAPGTSTSWAMVMQLTPSGDLDPTFGAGEGYLIISTTPGDSSFLSRLVIDADGTIDYPSRIVATLEHTYLSINAGLAIPERSESRRTLARSNGKEGPTIPFSEIASIHDPSVLAFGPKWKQDFD